MNGTGAAPAAARERLQELCATLAEPSPSPAAAAARELLQLIFSLHGEGLARMLELIGESADGSALRERLVQDEQTRALLLLHDLHPQDLAARVTEALTGLRPHLAVYGIRVEEFALNDARLRLSLNGAAADAAIAPAPGPLRREIEAAVYALAPDLEAITIDGLPMPTAYVPLSRLGRPQSALARAGRGS